MKDPKLDDVEQCEEIFNFLQGKIPNGYRLKDTQIPRLTPDQAWTVVWYIQNLYWELPDKVERCDVCGDLYDSECRGGHREDGPPYNFCDPCYDKVPPESDED